MEDWQDRTKKLIGKEKQNKIQNTKIAIFGLGGVGGFVFEALLRSGVKNLAIVDGDNISNSNLNRQIIASIDNVGKSKVKEFEKRAKSINKDANIYALNKKITENNLEEILEDIEKNIGKLEYIIDAVDDLKVKVKNILICQEKNIKCISSMGAGFKLDTRKIKDENIFKTKTCRLAKKIRAELKKFLKSEKNTKNLKEKDFKNIIAVYSEEDMIDIEDKKTVASMIFVPASFGIRIAEICIRDIIQI